ncbi:uncharacterized protein PAC_06494 [Phialocephala subalpina]|uniref:RING-type domain-containing protein n=1 Tax=Phialocephala subalpina TaxID=576137 RepID=A0A1L7WV06_9HELO|nr:uncharacterized protein PAC_06494 [Phialocephala subalpina]
MPYIQEISFFHGCGHAENCIWAFAGEMPDDSTRQGLPTINFVRFMNTIDEGYTDETTELHYRKIQCSSCDGTLGESIDPLIPLPEAVLDERRMLWRGIVTSFEFHCQVLRLAESVETARNLRLGDEQEQLEKRLVTKQLEEFNQDNQCYLHQKELLSHRNTIFDMERKESDSKLRQANQKRRLFQAFNTLRQIQEHNGVENKVYMLAPGWDTDLLAIATVSQAAFKDSPVGDEECSICFRDLYSGRARKLPCGHVWHHGCITEWLQTKRSCPMCRANYKILRPPAWTSNLEVERAQRNLRELLDVATGIELLDDSDGGLDSEWADEDGKDNSDDGEFHIFVEQLFLEDERRFEDVF